MKMIAAKKTHLPRAAYARGILTLDLPTAREPVLWRQEIRNISTITFSLHQLNDYDRALILRVADGAEQIIATFDNAAAADDALDALRGILLRPRSKFSLLNIFKWLVVLGLLWLVLVFGLNIGMNVVPPTPPEAQQAAPPSPPTAAPPTVATGVDTAAPNVPPAPPQPAPPSPAVDNATPASPKAQ